MMMSREQQVAYYAAAQQRFDEMRKRIQFRAGREICDLAYANLYDRTPPEVLAALHEAIDRDRALNLQYTPYGGATIPRRLVAQSLSKSHGESFKWRDIVLTPGAMAGLNLLFRSLVTEKSDDDEVIVPVPCWLDYPLYLANLGLKPRLVPLDRNRFDLDLDAIANSIGPNTRAIVLSQPSNPTGRLYSGVDLTDLARLLEESQSQPLLISDECHRDIRFGDAEFVSPASLYDRTCIVYSFGKNLSMQGQRIGYVAISPRLAKTDSDKGVNLAIRLEVLARALGFATPTTLMQSALGALLKIKPDWSIIAERRQKVLDAFTQGPEVIPSDATFFLYVRTGHKNDFEVAEALAESGVLALPSALFHDHGHLRLSLTCSDEMLERAIPQLVETICDRYPA